MEQDDHAAWLWTERRNRCGFGCRRGFINVHSLIRHYLSEDCKDVPYQGRESCFRGVSYLASYSEVFVRQHIGQHMQTPSSHVVMVERDTHFWYLPDGLVAII